MVIVGGEMKTKLKPPPQPPISPLSSGPEIMVVYRKVKEILFLERTNTHTVGQIDYVGNPEQIDFG